MSRIIAFVGDTHGGIQAMYDWLWRWMERTEQRIDAVVQVGDFGIYLERDFDEFGRYWRGERKIPIRTWVCPGNHEDHAVIKLWEEQQTHCQLTDGSDRIPNLHLMPDGGVTEIKGLKIASVWGNFSPKSWMEPERVAQSRKQGDGGRVAMHIYRDAVTHLLNDIPVGGMDVLVTHDAPGEPIMFPELAIPSEQVKRILGLDPDEPVGGCLGFTFLRETHAPSHHFFGHVHVPREVEVDGTKIICLQALDYQRDSESFHFLSF